MDLTKTGSWQKIKLEKLRQRANKTFKFADRQAYFTFKLAIKNRRMYQREHDD